MTEKETLKIKIAEFKELLPARPNGDRRILSPDDRALVELLESIVDALPD